MRSQHVHLALEDSRSASFQVGLEPEDVGSEEGDAFDEEASYVESDDSIASGQEEPEDESEGEDKGEGSSSTDSTSDSSSDDDEEKGEESSEGEKREATSDGVLASECPYYRVPVHGAWP